MNDLIVIVVLYNKNISDLPIIMHGSFMKDSSIDIFVYDNSMESQYVPKIEGFNFYYIHDKSNAGVSKAYNSGIKKAKELNKKYVLLLDQDSSVLASNLEKYLFLAERYGENYIYAPVMYSKNMIYSPACVNHFIGKVQGLNTFVYQEIYSLKKKSLINSGLMIPIKVIDVIGYFDENIKLDFSDFYFIEKYKKINQDIILLNLYIQHKLSGNEDKNYTVEMLRYKYYCNGAKFFNISTNTFRLIPPFRRMLSLIIKYKNLKPIGIFLGYFIGNKRI
ncbi:glycosyltransferase [Sulfuricurvum sp.]|uniref:glycosyltransferase n=1 Tax=Sulfuricurvum sp. TaxID=2025608 RepID=UPI003569497A